ncbi:Metastasis-associated protein mta1 [Blomia tropicalis]|nr:Metastasis-associated protein mta1 [Blomia tropicalis]
MNPSFQLTTRSNLKQPRQPFNFKEQLRIGEFAFVEISPNLPYDIYRIEKITLNKSGVKILGTFLQRKNSISKNLIDIAKSFDTDDKLNKQVSSGDENQLFNRELYITEETICFSSKKVKGKCSVLHHNGMENLNSLINRNEMFYYSLNYNPTTKSFNRIVCKSVRIGKQYQANVPKGILRYPESEDTRILENMETLVYKPTELITDKEIDQFIVIVKSTDTYGKILLSRLNKTDPILDNIIKFNDNILQVAMDILFKYQFNLSKAILSLVPNDKPLVFDNYQTFIWSSEEIRLFEYAFGKYHKMFNKIHQHYLPWKSLKNIISFYYLWKKSYIGCDNYCNMKVKSKNKQHFEIDNSVGQMVSPLINIPQNELQTMGKCESCRLSCLTKVYPCGPN